MRWLFAVCIGLLLLLQYRLWIADGSLAERQRLEKQVEEQTRVNDDLRARNVVLAREVVELRTGNKSVEQRAREDLGLIREGETYYHLEQGAEVPANDNKDD